MDKLSNYSDQFFTLNNPFFLGLLLTVILIIASTYIIIKIILPIHKEYVAKGQRFLLEKAELMALFAEMDPDPLIRTNNSGVIIQTNEVSRAIFSEFNLEGRNIKELIPDFDLDTKKEFTDYIEKIGDKTYSIHIKSGKALDFTNIYLHDITRLRNYEIILEEYKNKLKALAEIKDAENDELRKNISYELHDDICQKLWMLKYEIAGLDADTGKVMKNLESIYQQTRDLSRELRPADIPSLGLRICLRNLTEGISEKSGIKGKFNYLGKDEKFPDQLEKCIYSVTQVALSNVVKHSKAQEFSVKLQILDGFADLIISDDGIGIPEDYFITKDYKKYGMGLFNVKERIEKFNGSFKIISNNEAGTVLVAQIPIRKIA